MRSIKKKIRRLISIKVWINKVYGLNNLTFSNDTIKQNGISIMVKIGDINR